MSPVVEDSDAPDPEEDQREDAPSSPRNEAENPPPPSRQEDKEASPGQDEAEDAHETSDQQMEEHRTPSPPAIKSLAELRSDLCLAPLEIDLDGELHVFPLESFRNADPLPSTLCRKWFVHTSEWKDYDASPVEAEEGLKQGKDIQAIGSLVPKGVRVKSVATQASWSPAFLTCYLGFPTIDAFYTWLLREGAYLPLVCIGELDL